MYPIIVKTSQISLQDQGSALLVFINVASVRYMLVKLQVDLFLLYFTVLQRSCLFTDCYLYHQMCYPVLSDGGWYLLAIKYFLS